MSKKDIFNCRAEVYGYLKYHKILHLSALKVNRYLVITECILITIIIGIICFSKIETYTMTAVILLGMVLIGVIGMSYRSHEKELFHEMKCMEFSFLLLVMSDMMEIIEKNNDCDKDIEMDKVFSTSMFTLGLLKLFSEYNHSSDEELLEECLENSREECDDMMLDENMDIN